MDLNNSIQGRRLRVKLLRDKHVPYISVKTAVELRRIFQVWDQKQRPYTVEYIDTGCIDCPISFQSVFKSNRMCYTIENTVTDSPLLRNIGVEHRCEEPSLRCLVRVSRVHVHVHQEY